MLMSTNSSVEDNLIMFIPGEKIKWLEKKKEY